jgi:glycerol uptake facilitator-like aquaporin
VGFKGFIAATAAVALMAAPTVAAAQSVEVAPASETVSEGSELRGGFIIPLIAIIAIILGILAAINDDDDNLPESP